MSKNASVPVAQRRRRPAVAQISGAKGGEKQPHQPYKAPDSALSIATAKLLYILSEGPIVGPVDGLRSVKLNGTPLISPDGSENFPGTHWDFRPGTVDQEHIAGFPAVENEASQGLPVELTSDNAWTRAITDQQLSAVRIRLSWPQIWELKSNGDQVGYRIDYAIDLSVDGASYQTVISATLDDKGTTEYERSHRIDLPEGFTSALVRVRRLTANRNDSNWADLMRIKALTEVIDAKLRYPNLALGGLQFDAKQFQDTPKFSLRARGRIIRVPSNYNPESRTYVGNWDGTFKQAYSNNSAWVWYDLLLHRRYGLGRRITADMVDRWTLYEIGRYCDVLVSNGKGGQEPRMTTNVYIQDQAEGYALLSDLASVFHGSSCWNGSMVTMIADIPGNEDGYVFTRSNVIGEFEYGAVAWPDRHTRAKVAWDNPANEFKTQPVAVTNEEMIGALGHRMLDVGAFGCTSEGQAMRHGIWALKSEQYESWAVTFTTGMEGRNVEPGQIICVADELLSGRPNGGRISAATRRVITIDIDAQIKPEDRLIINLPSGKSEGRIVKSVLGRQITVMADYSELPVSECSWSVESSALAVMRFRVQTIEPQGLHQFKISAIQHEPQKYAAIDTGARIDPQPISIIPPGVMPAPTGIAIESRSVVSQGIAITTMRITWASVPGAIAYNVEWRKDSGNWIRLPRTGNLGAEVEGIYSGRYVARVSAINAMDVSSIWGTSNEVVLTGKQGLPPAVSFLKADSLLFGIGLKWGFPAGAEDTQRTEIWYGTTTNIEAATKLADLAYPQSDYSMQSLLAGATFFFWARLIDRSGNVGPFYPTGMGVMGQASSDAGPILDQIAGQISETELGQDLLSRIELIDGPPTLPGSVSNRVDELGEQIGVVTDHLQELVNEGQAALSETQQAFSEAQAELQLQIDQVSTLAKSGEYQKDKAYTAGASTRLNDRLYQAKIAVPADASGAKSPPNATYWVDVGQVVSDSNGLAARVSITETKITSIEGVNTSQGTAITGLTNSLTTTNGNVTAAQNAANAANTLAGGKGKVIVQTGAPAAADQLAQNLWIDITGGANTPKRWNGSAWVAVTDKVATDAAAAAANALSVANTKADASAVNSLTTRVEAAEGTISSQGSSITGLTNSLTTTNGNVTAAQNAANAANTLAGGKGKVIVQTAAPAVADQLAQNLWIDITGSANTPKRWNGSAWVAVTDKVATDAAAAAANALSVANTKADASAVNSLTTRVEAAEGTISSQGTSITGLTNSLTTTNGNVTAAQNAANAANTLAGGKGKVIVQTAAPAAADQLAQNLWIDITGGANTPKRWTGSAWAAVTDKIATDAAAAAASALSQVATKADASAVTSLGTRVTAAEGLITSQGSSIVSLINSIGDVGSENLFYNPAFVKLGSVTGVADGWAVNTPITPGASTGVYSLVPSWINASENAQRIDVTGLTDTNLYRSIIPVAAVRPALQAGASVALSVYFRATAGLQVRIYLEANNAAGNVLSVPSTSLIVATGSTQRATLLFANLPANTAKVTSFFRIFGGSVTAGFVEFTRAQLELGSVVSGWRDSTLALASDQAATSAALSSLTSTVTQQGTTLTSQGASLTSLTNSLTTTNTNVTAAQAAADAANTLAGGKGKVLVQAAAPAAADQLAQNLWIDITGGANTPKRWTGSAWAAVTDKVATDAAAAAASALSQVATKADASAVTSLGTRVTAAEGSITSQGNSITSLTNNLSSVGGENLLYNPSFDKAGTTAGVAEGWVLGQAPGVVSTPSLVASAIDPAGKAQRLDVTGLNASNYADLGPLVANRPSASAGQALTMSAYVRATAGLSARLYFQFKDAAGATISTDGPSSFTTDGNVQRITKTTSSPAPANTVAVHLLFRVVGTASLTAGFVEWDRAQLELSPVVTGWKDSAKTLAADQVVTSDALSSLTSTVTQQGTTLTSQGASLTSLNNSLTTTNTNVTAAQTAANAANTLAGGKGKVIVQTGAPAAADQLAQNLWIDITGGANTPKRWTGSAWVAVTDKVATDAAAAAANALSVANTKADASAVSSLTTRVTAAEGTISNQGASITSLTNSLNAIGGDNLLPNSSFETLAAGSTARPLYWSVGGTAVPTPSIVDSVLPSSTKALRITRLAATNGQYSDVLFNSLEAARPKVTPGQPYTLSVWARGSAATVRLATYVQFLDAAGSTVLSTMTLAEVALTTMFTRYVLTGVAPAGAAFGGIYAGRMFNRSGGTMDMWMEVDNVQFQEGSVATAYAPSNERNTEALSAAISSLSSTVTSQGSTLTSQGNSLTQLTNRVGDAEGVNSGQATALNSLDTRVTSTEGKVTAQSTAFQALQASSRDDNGEGDLADALKGWTSTAAIASESKVRTSENEAFAQRITGFDARIDENTASITELEQVVATNNSATATKIDQLNVSVASNTAAIQQTSTVFADTNGKLSSMWSVKMQINAQGQYVAAGIGLGIENTGAGLQSQFLVSADRFAIVNGINGNLSVPFAVQNGQAFLQSAFILDGTITNAKIGSYISSNNYIPGQQGWVLYKDGTLEINGIVPGQGRLVINSQNVSVYDANNVLRVRLGYLG